MLRVVMIADILAFRIIDNRPITPLTDRSDEAVDGNRFTGANAPP